MLKPNTDVAGRAFRVAPANADPWERAGRVKGAQRRSGPLTRPSGPGKSGTGATYSRPEIPAHVDADCDAMFGNSSLIGSTDTHAPQHISDTDKWGASDPAGRLRGRGCDSMAGSLTPHPCCDTSAGALLGRHKPPPVVTAAPAPRLGRPRSCGGAQASTATSDEAPDITIGWR
jgi:hypothetical protein